MKKKITLLVALVATTALWAEDFSVDGIYYNILADKTNEVEVTSGSTKYSGSVTILSAVTYNGTTYSVTSIGESAFSGCSGLTFITIPNSITSIGKRAFYGCSGLTSVTIPNGVTSIGESAFSGCSGLTSVVWNAEKCANFVTNSYAPFDDICSNITSFAFGDSVQHIPAYLCYDMTKLTSITIPSSVTRIGEYAFYGCSGLTFITIPNSITSIGKRAFYGCSGLTSVVWNAEKCANFLTNSYAPFDDICSNITSFAFGDSVQHIPAYLCYDMTKLTSITIPSSVTRIGEYAFCGCSGLTKFTIGNSVATIGRLAFYGCSRLTSVSIPISVTTIESGAFLNCNSLISIKVESRNRTYNSHKSCNAIIETATNKLIVGCKNTVIPNSVTSIGNSAFYGCSGLTSITIPNSVTSIGNSAFCGCSGLTSITIPNSVTSIGDDAFNGTAVYNNESNWESGVLYISNCLIAAQSNISGTCTIKDGTRLIGDQAFEGCSSLTSIIIPESVTHIGSAIVWACRGLTSVTWNAKNCSTSSYSSDSPFYWSNSSITSFTFGNTVERVPSYLCYGMEKLTSMNLPNSVTSIGDAAFNGCSGLTSITIPNSVTSIGEDAFEDCSSLTKTNYTGDIAGWCDIKFGGSTANPMYYSHNFFINDQEIKDLVIPNTVDSIHNYAFDGCSSLTSITIPESVTSIGEYAFYGCFGLTSVVWNAENCADFSSSSYAPFNNICSNITSFTFGDSVQHIPAYLCYDMTKLTSITIPSSVTSIGDRAFYGCSSLTSVTIPNSVTSIGDYAFSSCSGLTSVVWNAENCADFSSSSYAPFYDICSNITSFAFGDSVQHIPAYLCYDMTKLTSITIPSSVTSIGDYAFSSCSGLTSITIPNSVTTIGGQAFCGCGLTSITIPNSVTSIGYAAFYHCSSLTKTNYTGDIAGWCDIKFGGSYANPMTYSHNFYINDQEIKDLVIPNTVDSIHNYAFDGCSSLTSITIPESVTSIGEYAFYRCSSLTSITCEAITPPTIGENAFDRVSYSIPVYVPCGRVDAYKAAEDWKDFTNIQEPLAEYSIEVNVNDATRGIANVDYNTFCEGNQLSATPNIGYHFVQWSDGSTYNPRTLELTQDTILTAEFAANKYLISTVSNDPKRGTTSGDTLAAYLDYVTISATAKYGYHFSSWENGNADNPRQVQVTGDKEYMAYFDKNTYTVTTSCDGNYGTVSPSVTGEYLDTITLTATPTLGYYFSRWSDGNTQNPRKYVVKKDVTLTAEFAQSFAGQCGDNLYWAYNESDQSIAITGTGDMYNYTSGTQPWILFLEKIKKVTTDNTAASLGTSAFEGAIRLAEVHIGAKIDMIEANVFAGCDRLRNIYCYPTYPPIIRESSFARYDALLYIPCDYLDDYVFDNNWKRFENIQCAGAEKEEIESDGVDVDPSSTSVTMTWPTEENANTYTIEIMKDGALFCRLVFNTAGQLLNISFAPSRDGNNRPAQYAEQVANGSGLRFTVTGLNESTHYTYDLRAKDKDENTIQSHSGEFTTKSNVTTDMDNIQSPVTTCQKVMRDGQLIIIRDGVEYNAMGQEIH